MTQNPLEYLRANILKNTNDAGVVFSDLIHTQFNLPEEMGKESKKKIKQQLEQILIGVKKGSFILTTSNIEVQRRYVESRSQTLDPDSTVQGYLAGEFKVDSKRVLISYLETFIEFVEGKKPVTGGRRFHPNNPLVQYEAIPAR
jgi:hypothetical protein